MDKKREDSRRDFGLNLNTIGPPRLTNALHDGGIKSILDLIHRSPNQLLSLEGIGKRSLQLIRDTLRAQGLSLLANPPLDVSSEIEKLQRKRDGTLSAIMRNQKALSISKRNLRALDRAIAKLRKGACTRSLT